MSIMILPDHTLCRALQIGTMTRSTKLGETQAQGAQHERGSGWGFAQLFEGTYDRQNPPPKGVAPVQSVLSTTDDEGRFSPTFNPSTQGQYTLITKPDTVGPGDVSGRQYTPVTVL